MPTAAPDGVLRVIPYGPDGNPAGQAAVALSDSLANPTTTQVGANLLAYNGASWDRRYNNTQGTMLASAARTATTNSAIQTNVNARGVLLMLNVTAASGTGGLTVGIEEIFPTTGAASGNFLLKDTAAITSTGGREFLLYPGAVHSASDTVRLASGLALPRAWIVNVAHGDASSYTYSLDFALIN